MRAQASVTLSRKPAIRRRKLNPKLKMETPMAQYPTDMHVHPTIASFFDPQTNTISYVVVDPGSAAAQ
jgi:hypothetical protein